MNFKANRTLLVPLCATLCLFLSACANKPVQYSNKDIHLDLPDEWKIGGTQSSQSTNVDRGDWVEQLSVVQVQKQINIALNNNPNLHALFANIKGQQLLANIAKRNKYPDVNLQLDINRQKVTKGLSANTEELQLQFISTWEADVWGRLSSTEKSAVWQQQVAIENFQFAKLSLSGQVAQLWIDAIEQQQLINLNRQEIESWLLSHQILENDYHEGVAAKTAVHLTQTQVALAKANYHQLIQAKDDAIRQILTIQGRFPDISQINLPTHLPEVPELSIDHLSMGTLEQRPDVKAAMAHLESLDAAASAAYRALYPQFKLTLAPQLITNRLSNISAPDRLIDSTLSILQPLFSRNSLLLNTRVAETKSEQAYWQYMQAVLGASGEIMQTMDNHKHLLKREEQLVLAGKEAYLASTSANEDYEQGVGNVLDWLSLKRSLLTIEQQIVRNRAKRLKNWVSAHLALASPITSVN